VRFFWAKEIKAKYTYKEIFFIYGRKCLSRKAAQNWKEKFSQRLSKVSDDARPGRPVGIATKNNCAAAGNVDSS
jgi:hypothetical protein